MFELGLPQKGLFVQYLHLIVLLIQLDKILRKTM